MFTFTAKHKQMMKQVINAVQPKPHYVILDGLRGVGAIMVLLVHLFETFSLEDHTTMIINHGYLAVDLFFMLSGYVISYAYDSRWNRMSIKGFLTRRWIRLQPMIIIGSLLGASLFYFQQSEILGWERIGETPVWKLLLVTFIGMTIIPVGKSLDIRGWDEMYPLNGTNWTLFFEYIAYIFYALILRKISKLGLGILLGIAAGFMVHHAFTNSSGVVTGGWSFSDTVHLRIGFIRMSFSFLSGMFLARIFSLKSVKYAFFTTSVILIAALSVPHLGAEYGKNAFYECLVLMMIFPLLILMSAGGKVSNPTEKKICLFLGNISYPMYIIHFPFIYVFRAWAANENKTLQDTESWIYGILIMIICFVSAYLFMRFYERPLRKWLSTKLLPDQQ